MTQAQIGIVVATAADVAKLACNNCAAEPGPCRNSRVRLGRPARQRIL